MRSLEKWDKIKKGTIVLTFFTTGKKIHHSALISIFSTLSIFALSKLITIKEGEEKKINSSCICNMCY